MRKTATLLLLMVIIFMFSFGSDGSSSTLVITKEQKQLRYEQFLYHKEQDRRALVERQLYDSLKKSASIKWLLTGFLDTQIFIESTGRQSAISPEGAQGIAQFMPTTWQELIRLNLLPYWFDINNEAHQRIAQLVYLDYLYTMWKDRPRDRRALTAASYNAGPNAIKHIVRKHGSEWRNHIPVETSDYLKKLKKYV